MRTFLLTVGALAMAIALGSCGGGDDEQSASRTATEQAETTDAGGATTPKQETTEQDDASTEPEDATTESDDTASGDSGGDSGGDDNEETPSQDDQPSDSAAGGDAETAAGATVVTFFKALADGDGDEACSLMIQRVRDQLDKGLAQAPQYKGKKCAELISTLSKSYPDATRTQMSSLKVVKTQAKGSVVLVTYKGPGNTNAQVPVVNDGGTWKIGAATGSP